MAEMQGFEPWRRQNRPTGFRIRTLQPLGYISVSIFDSLDYNAKKDIKQQVFCRKRGKAGVGVTLGTIMERAGRAGLFCKKRIDLSEENSELWWKLQNF